MQSTYKQHRPGRGVVEIASGGFTRHYLYNPHFFCSDHAVRASPGIQDNSASVSSISHIVGNRQFVEAVLKDIRRAKGITRMMKKIAVILCGLAVMGGTLSAHAQDDKAKIGDRLTAAGQVVDEIMATPDKGIPSGILAGASCVVVIPSYKKGAFVVGAQYGQGVATCRTSSGKWSAPVCVQLAGGSFGFQIGGQATDLVLVAMNQQGLQQMLKNKFKLGADAAAAAGPVGRNAQAGTDWKLNAEFLSYSRSKGLFAGINLDGTVLSQNQDDTRTLYGADLPFAQILDGKQPTPDEARPFVRTVAKYFVVAKNR
jgi:SH3 domain-containing YSC84-like protein 1